MTRASLTRASSTGAGGRGETAPQFWNIIIFLVGGRVSTTDGVCDFNVPYGPRSLKATRLRATWFGDGLGLRRPAATHPFSPVAFILKFKVQSLRPRLHSDVLLSLQLGKVYGIESHVLSPAETKDLYPLMNVDDLYGTLYVPKDGTMDPAGTCTTLSRAASARGAKVGRHSSAQ